MCVQKNHDDQDKIKKEVYEQYKIAIDMHKEESNRYWTRNNVFLILNGAFIAIFGKEIGGNSVVLLFISFLGIILSIVWQGISLRGKNQIERWRKVIDRYEIKFAEELRIFSLADTYAKELTIKCVRPKFIDQSASKLMNIGIKVIGLIWIIVFFISAGLLAKDIIRRLITYGCDTVC